MFFLAWRNIIRRLGSSVTTTVIIALAVCITVASGATCLSLYRGMGIARDRLGADIIVLPSDVGVSASQALFTAEPANIYLPENAADIVASVDGVARVTPQFFTQTLNQSCCSILGVTRVVGIDSASDFVLAPWIEGGIFPELGEDGIVVGSNAPEIVGGRASILGSTFHVVGTLEETGTSVDGTIFMDIGTARRIGSESPYLQGVWKNTDPFSSISAVMVEVDENADPTEVARAIEDAYPYAGATPTSGVIGSTAEQIALFLKVMVWLVAGVAAITAIALVGRMSAILHMRRREVALMRTLGLGRWRTFGTLATETGIISVFGGVVGSSLGVIAARQLIESIHDAMSLPGSTLEPSTAAIAGVIGIIGALAIGIVSLAIPLTRSSYLEPQELIGKGEL